MTTTALWIPIKDELPVVNEYVLFCCYDEEDEAFGDVYLGWFKGDWTASPDAIAMETVPGEPLHWFPCTHWATLPAVPRAVPAVTSYDELLDILPRLLDIGYKIVRQEDKWHVFRSNGEGVVCGDTFREMCEKLLSLDVAEHEKQYLEQCSWYRENRDRLLGRKP